MKRKTSLTLSLAIMLNTAAGGRRPNPRSIP